MGRGAPESSECLVPYQHGRVVFRAGERLSAPSAVWRETVWLMGPSGSQDVVLTTARMRRPPLVVARQAELVVLRIGRGIGYLRIARPMVGVESNPGRAGHHS